jgi:hypothetical protein
VRVTRILALALGVAVAAASGGSAARAAPVTWEIDGTIVFVSGGVFGSLGIGLGTPYTARVVVDAPLPGDGSQGQLLSMEFSAGSYHATVSAPAGYSSLGFGGDILVATMVQSGSFGTLPANPELLFTVDSPAWDGVPTDTIPFDPLPVADLVPYGVGPNGGSYFTAYGVYGSSPAEINGDITRWVTVPEAPLAWLVPLAALAWHVRARGRPRAVSGFRTAA